MFDPANKLDAPFLLDNQEVLAETVQRARLGDKAAFGLLYLYYKAPIWRCLLHLVGQRDVVSDLFQETFLRAWNKLSQTKEKLQFEPWIKRIAANLAIDYLRREKKIVFVPLLEDEQEESSQFLLASEGNFEDGISEMDCVQQSLARLSPRSRTCLLLQDLWGFSQHEIAQLLNISEKSVGAYASRGREQLRLTYNILSDEVASETRRERLL